MSGAAVISGNTATLAYGGVYARYAGTFTMEGGEVSGNVSNTWNGGGGVGVDGGTFVMKAGTISGNTADGGVNAPYGGGVYVHYGTFTMSGGTNAGAPLANTASIGAAVYSAVSPQDTTEDTVSKP
jgi:hypothetical protein